MGWRVSEGMWWWRLEGEVVVVINLLRLQSRSKRKATELGMPSSA